MVWSLLCIVHRITSVILQSEKILESSSASISIWDCVVSYIWTTFQIWARTWCDERNGPHDCQEGTWMSLKGRGETVVMFWRAVYCLLIFLSAVSKLPQTYSVTKCGFQVHWCSLDSSRKICPSFCAVLETMKDEFGRLWLTGVPPGIFYALAYFAIFQSSLVFVLQTGSWHWSLLLGKRAQTTLFYLLEFSVGFQLYIK